MFDPQVGRECLPAGQVGYGQHAAEGVMIPYGV